MALAFDIGSLLDSDPTFYGGRPFIRGRRVTVQRIAVLYNEGARPDDIARRYALQPEQVFAALAYYCAEQARIDSDIDEQDADYERLAAEHRPFSLAARYASAPTS